MEEKERYEVISPSLNGYAYIHDFKTDNVLNTYDSCDLLNQQSKRIKELEEELDDAKRDYIPKLEFGLQRANKMGRDAEKEIQQLKQQLHDLPKKIVEEIRYDMSKRIMEKQIKWGDNTQIGFICNAINECLDTILKKYGDKNESNND